MTFHEGTGALKLIEDGYARHIIIAPEYSPASEKKLSYRSIRDILKITHRGSALLKDDDGIVDTGLLSL